MIFRRMAPWTARIATALAGILLLAAAAMNPLVSGETMDVNDDRQTKTELFAGDVLEQTVTVPGAISQFSLRADGVKDAKELTLTVTLWKGNSLVTEQSFSLEKTKAKGKLMVDLPREAAAGEYTLRVKAEGSGSVKLGGGTETTARINGDAAIRDAPCG